ncbi:MAG: hypothetical protein QW128_06255 [Thermoprotei archaeon]
MQQDIDTKAVLYVLIISALAAGIVLLTQAFYNSLDKAFVFFVFIIPLLIILISVILIRKINAINSAQIKG